MDKASFEFTYGEINYVLCGLEELRSEYRADARLLKGWSDDRSAQAMDHAKAITRVMAKLRRKERALRDG